MLFEEEWIPPFIGRNLGIITDRRDFSVPLDKFANSIRNAPTIVVMDNVTQIDAGQKKT
jgi:hypothetical protein